MTLTIWHSYNDTAADGHAVISLHVTLMHAHLEISISASIIIANIYTLTLVLA